MRQTMEQHKAEYRARSLSDRLNGTFTDVAAKQAKPMPVARVAPSKAYKPVHGGYPS